MSLYIHSDISDYIHLYHIYTDLNKKQISYFDWKLLRNTSSEEPLRKLADIAVYYLAIKCTQFFLVDND